MQAASKNLNGCKTSLNKVQVVWREAGIAKGRKVGGTLRSHLVEQKIITCIKILEINPTKRGIMLNRLKLLPWDHRY